MVKGFGVTATENGLLNAVPWALAGFMLTWLPRRLRRDGAMLRAVAIIALAGICCFVASTLLPGKHAALHRPGARRALPVAALSLLLVGPAPASSAAPAPRRASPQSTRSAISAASGARI
ncbi:MAG: hypothetical protein WDN69_04760 [Aliidongia sp.]